MEYVDFFKDLPRRCATMLGLNDAAAGEDLAVTQILCFLTTALTIPHERLKPSKDKLGKSLVTHCAHPSGDTLHFADAAMQYCKLEETPFLTWVGSAGSWQKGTLSKVAWATNWPPQIPQTRDFDQKASVVQVLTVMRHALSHGNILTGSENCQINKVAFLCVDKTSHKDLPGEKGYMIGKEVTFEYVAGSVSDLRIFIQCWASFLSGLKGGTSTGDT